MLRTARIGLPQLLPLPLGVLLAVLTTGCPARGIGDPCTPEAIPSGGFDPREVYVETSSVQCRTRTCIVFRLRGDPTCVLSTDPSRNTCDPVRCGDRCVRDVSEDGSMIAAQDSLERVFCSCRCSAAGDTNTPLCQCTEGYHCVEVLTAGGPGIRGGYCVPNELCATDDDCPSRRCNLQTGTCVPGV
jgi:hypothetical protein